MLSRLIAPCARCVTHFRLFRFECQTAPLFVMAGLVPAIPFRKAQSRASLIGIAGTSMPSDLIRGSGDDDGKPTLRRPKKWRSSRALLLFSLDQVRGGGAPKGAT